LQPVVVKDDMPRSVAGAPRVIRNSTYLARGI
jgi:hypothetical protein